MSKQSHIERNRGKVAWAKRNSDRMKEARQRYRERMSAAVREQHNERTRAGREKNRLALIALLGGECAGINGIPCPYKCRDTLILEFDHINGDGFLEKRTTGAHMRVRKYLAMGQDAKKIIQNLCPNCHVRKTKMQKEYKGNRDATVSPQPLPLFCEGSLQWKT